MARETGVQSQVESYQRLKKWYLMPPCLTLSIIRYGSRVKWSNPGKGVAPFPTPWCSSYRKGSLRLTLDYGRQLYFTYLFKTIQISISTQFNCQRHFNFKLFKQLYVTIQLSVDTVLMSKNSSISINSVKHKHTV